MFEPIFKKFLSETFLFYGTVTSLFGEANFLIKLFIGLDLSLPLTTEYMVIIACLFLCLMSLPLALTSTQSFIFERVKL